MNANIWKIVKHLSLSDILCLDDDFSHHHSCNHISLFSLFTQCVETEEYANSVGVSVYLAVGMITMMIPPICKVPW